MKFLHLLMFLVFLPVYMFAGIAGTYEVKGFSPNHVPYAGTVVIAKVSEGIYSATWTFDDQSIDLGTGVRKGSTLSFVFHETSTNTDGTQLYEFGPGKTLRGPWIRFGATEKGFEKLRKIHDSSS